MYIKINKIIFSNHDIFDFDIFIKNENNKAIPIVLKNNSIKEEVATLISELKTLNTPFYIRQEYEDLYKQLLKTEGPHEFKISKELNNAIISDEYDRILNQITDEINSFDISPTDHAYKDYLLFNNIINQHSTSKDFLFKISSFNYYFLKYSGVKKQNELIQVFLASYFSLYGLTQLPIEIINKPQANLNAAESEILKDQIHLNNLNINKLHLITDPATQKIISQVREVNTRSKQFKQNELHPFSLYIALTIHLFELSNGKLNGQLFQIKQLVILLKNKHKLPQLEFDFGPDAINSIISLIYTDNLN